jgi:thiol-disulfide isomerase/thioredoxin
MTRKISACVPLLAAMALVLPLGAHGQQLYKCTKDGKTAYQDSPCPEEAVSKQLKNLAPEAQRESAGGVETIDVEAAARRIRSRSGPTVVVLYSSKCPVCQEMFPQLSELARQYQGRGISWEVLSTDEAGDAEQVAPFLAQSRAPFPPVMLRPSPPGALTRAMEPLGINIGTQWAKPFVAVRDASGKVVMQGEGVANLSQARGAIDAIAPPRQ